MIINVYDMIDDVLIMKFFVFCSDCSSPRDFVWNAVVVDPQLDEIDEWFSATATLL